MTLYESVRFGLNLTDTSGSNDWEHLNVIPKGFGRTHLGPEQRVFVTVMYHQMHCLTMLHRALLDFEENPLWTDAASPHHIWHCLDYLRQGILCKATDDVETGDFMERDFEEDRIGETLVCEDWERAYEELDANEAKWESWRGQWN